MSEMNLGEPRGMAEVAFLEPCISVQYLIVGVGQPTFDSRAEKAILPRAR